MTYSTGDTVHLIAGRLALNFLNTANWSEDGEVVREKIETPEDLDIWLREAGFAEAAHPASLEALYELRDTLRRLFSAALESDRSQTDLSRIGQQASQYDAGIDMQRQSILSLIAISALSVLSDPNERRRIKMCPGTNCGWMFVDETKNERRKWCTMELCGNRAKARRNYAKGKTARPAD